MLRFLSLHPVSCTQWTGGSLSWTENNKTLLKTRSFSVCTRTASLMLQDSSASFIQRFHFNFKVTPDA